MMKISLPVFILLISLGSLSAQSFKVNFKGQPSANVNAEVIDTLKILAIMVNFQEDRDGATFGNGKFGSIYSIDYGSTILDPLPHDEQYFKDHLLFVRNYFQKVSNNILYIEFEVLPDTFSVKQAMRNYSPLPGSDDFTPLGNFAVEAWTLADQLYPGFDFSAYDLFTIFHAGVGRDISLPGSIGNERDLPSVYLSEMAFKDIFGESFDGIPVSGGSFKITNSMIMPETESRELETISGTFLFEITINGLLCASVGSHLGLPDLFDTETGLSAIGRFGLMDGQGIFAFGGTYPPEPCPWSRIFLGWAEPATVDLDNADVSLVTKLAAEIGDTVILKVPLNSSEYYLIENRNRDANDDGSTVTYIVNGITITRTFTKDTTGYQSFDVDSLAGVIIDVDEFDWAVPGNGILIWHIDENIINEKIAENKVNTDKKRRGVDVEEADGVQDIGEEFQTIFGDIVIGEGTDRDFWYSLNPAELYQNLFNKETRPNTRTNINANSLITIKDFSEISNRMSFRIEYGDSIIKPLFSFPLNLSSHIQGFSKWRDDNTTKFLIVSNSNLYVVNNTGIEFTFNNFSNHKTATVFNSILGTIGSKIKLWSAFINASAIDSFDVGEQITTSPVYHISDEFGDELIVGSENGDILFIRFDSLSAINPSLVINRIFSTSAEHSIKKIAAHRNYISVILNRLNSDGVEELFFDTDGGSFAFQNEAPVDIAISGNADKSVSIVLTDKNNIYILRGNKEVIKFSISSSGSINTLSLADLKLDGTNYIILGNQSAIKAYNLTGALADNFPFVESNAKFIKTSLIADIEGTNNFDIISATEDGRIFAIDGKFGNIISGFPISAGSKIISMILFIVDGKTAIATIDDLGGFTAWSISSIYKGNSWAEENGGNWNSSVLGDASIENKVNEFFPTDRAYNYPNPVYEGSTNIRYYVSEDSKINIKIFDLAGDFVAELNDDATGGMDNETVWNVGDIQSGVYLTRIEAVSASGNSEFAIIKIAVVK